MAEELRINITVDNAQADSKFQATASSATRMADGLRGAEQAISSGLNPSIAGMIGLLETAAPWLIALTAVIAAVTAYGKALDFVITEAVQAEKVEARLNAVIKSTGAVAGVSAEAAQDLASSLSELSGVEDDVILGAENIMLTFTGINKSIFPEATQLALDLSTAFGQDLQSSTVMLGKALEDPITGLTALRRVGVTFSEAEQDMIKNMMEHNRVAAAQGMIMEAVSRQVAGSAQAMGSTAAGEFSKLKNLFGEVAEDIGKVFTPMISAGLGALVTVLQEVVKGAKPMFDELKKASKELEAAFRSPEMRKALKEMGQQLGEVLGNLGPTAVSDFTNQITNFARLVAAHGPQIVNTFVRIAEAAAIISEAIAGVITSLQNMGQTAGMAIAMMSGMPGFAGGVSQFRGGMAMVHRDEAIFLPRGSTVLSNREAKEALAGAEGGGSGSFTFNGPVTFAIQGGDRLTLEDLARQVQTQQATSGATF